MKLIIFILITFFLVQSFGFRRQKEYCSLLAKCELPFPEADCPDSLRTGIKKLDYNEKKCNESKRLIEKGVPTTNYIGQKLFGFLGQKYRVDYEVIETLPINAAQFEYLLSDIPLAAKIVNAFQKTKYMAVYLDGEQKKYWRGNNGKNLTGEANLIAGGIAEKKLIYFGFGIVKILKWKLKGQVLFDFQYKVEEGKPIAYELNVVVFPGGAVVNAIMNMGLFKRVVKGKIIDVFTDITESAADMNKLSVEEILNKYKWNKEEVEKLKTLTSLK